MHIPTFGPSKNFFVPSYISSGRSHKNPQQLRLGKHCICTCWFSLLSPKPKPINQKQEKAQLFQLLITTSTNETIHSDIIIIFYFFIFFAINPVFLLLSLSLSIFPRNPPSEASRSPYPTHPSPQGKPFFFILLLNSLIFFIWVFFLKCHTIPYAVIIVLGIVI